MRVALISDIHGNRVALEAVLADIDRNGVDEIICLGDVSPLGPDPVGVLDIVRDRKLRCIMGNHDEFLLDPELIRRYNTVTPIIAGVDWCRDQLRAPDFDFLRSFHRELLVPMDGGSTLLLFHGSPRSHMELILATTPAAELDTILSGKQGTVMAGGHTHVQMMRQHKGQLLVNVGSVGLPFRQDVTQGVPEILDHAEYAVVESTDGFVRVQLERLSLDRSQLLKAARETKNPMRDMLIAQYS